MKIIMTPEDFKQNFIETKHRAHDLKFGNYGYNIRRGMAHSVAGWVEDAFAVYVALAQNNPNREYFVDKVISYKFDEMPKSKSFKPDVLVLSNQDNSLPLLATHLFDLKTDLGYNRDFEAFIDEKVDFIRKIRGRKVWTSWYETEGYKKTDITFSSKIKYSIAVVIDWNLDKTVLAEHVKYANATDEVNMFVLLNHIKDKSTNEIRVNEPEFNTLNTFLKDQIPG